MPPLPLMLSLLPIRRGASLLPGPPAAHGARQGQVSAGAASIVIHSPPRRGAAVAHYRVYLLMAPDRIKSGDSIDLDNDAAARRYADDVLAGERCDGIEVWNGTRLVYRKKNGAGHGLSLKSGGFD
jgi:hypothetical protein